jgi:putative DNA primase/helicase
MQQLNESTSIVRVTKEAILKKILEKVKPVDFKALVAKVNVNTKKVRERDILVLTIEYVLKLAEHNQTPFGRENGCTYLYIGTYWQCIEDKTLQLFLSSCAHRMGVDWTDARYCQFQDALLKQFVAVASCIRTSELASLCINLLNGTFDFGEDRGRLREHGAKDGLMYILPFRYEPGAVCPMFDSFLKKVLPDAACRDIIAEYVGSIFISSTTLKLEKALLLYGSGANGKSVLFEILNALLGTENITNFSLEKLTDTTGYYRAKFVNKLLNYSSEISKDLDTTVFKQLVSGEPVDARLPYGQPFIMRTYGKLMFNCNELPIDVEHNNAYIRRFIIIPFNVTIPESEQDKMLAHSIITSELSGVFNWVLEGMHRLLKHGRFTDSSIVAEQVQQYKIESDSVKLFLHELNYKPSDNDYEHSSSLYQNYQRFCYEDGYRNPVSKKIFRRRIESDGIIITRHNEGGHKIYLQRVPIVQEVQKVDDIRKLF